MDLYDSVSTLANHPGIRALADGSRPRPIEVESITAAAQPALVAALARNADGNLWVVCSDVRRQEETVADLVAWGAGALLFPDLQPISDAEVLPDPEALSERLEVLSRIAAGERGLCVVLTTAVFGGNVASPDTFKSEVLTIKKGEQHVIEAIESQLEVAGYVEESKIFTRGQFARRGGILDIFSWQHPLPHRIEFFGDEVESIREFQLDSQTSVSSPDQVEILIGDPDRTLCPITEYFSADDLVISLDAECGGANISISDQPRSGSPSGVPECFSPGIDVFGAGDFVIDDAKRNRFFSQVRDWIATAWTVVLACNNEGEWERFSELARDNGLNPDVLHFRESNLTSGFICPDVKLAILSDAELFGRSASQRMRRQMVRRDRAMIARSPMDFTEFEEGDFVVHVDHGIGRFLGMEKIAGDNSAGPPDTLTIEFADDSRLYVAVDQAWQVSRYVGLGKRHPDLSRLGDAKWDRAKKKAEGSIFEYAATMLKLQAERDTSAGFEFGPDTHWQNEFENAFVYQPTPDQVRAIESSKQDMESTRPMDRLICGDVGFGKTEVAIRAAFKAVMGGKQVVMIAPTTVLAQQHFQNLRERMSDYPVVIESMNRFRPRSEQTKTRRGLAAGTVDIVVGTHRLLSPDIIFKNLGLVIVDEEQRFGVKQKESLKDRFRLVDVLTLSATPIPRTLYLALMGARDMSLIETPPPNRKPVETVICAYDERVMRDAIQRELARGGQIYLLHNRVRTIDKLAERIRHLCPGASVGVGHGQMDEELLEVVMEKFVAGKLDVLVSTTIIESGLDIPNANTIIIDRADRFGLADLYQLRGRVGRSHHKAYAFLMLPRDLMASGDARKRVMAIKQYSELGAGFKIAMRDLEIRGAGNILGTAQSGHILAIGFDLYCKMLQRSVSVLKGEGTYSSVVTVVRLDFVATNEPEFIASSSNQNKVPAFIPSAYIQDPRMRIDAYRKLADARDANVLEALRKEWADRFGRPPHAVSQLLVLQKIRLEGAAKRLRVVEVRENKLMLKRKDDFILFGGKFPRLTSPQPENKLREVLEFLQKRQHI